MVAVVLGSVLLCCAVLRAASDHPSLYLRGKELESNNQGGGFPLKTTRVPQPKPLIDDCMLLPKTPSGKDLDKKRLFRKIGGESNVDLRFLSYAKPQSDETAAETISLRRVSTEMKNYLKEVIRNETKHMAGVHKKPGSNVERFMMKWLLHKSFCPVKYKWHDMGECSWPRWLALGYCVNKQCSWPSEMSCQPETTRIKMLRWVCPGNAKEEGRTTREATRKRKGTKKRRRRGCRWIPYERRVTTECSCSCGGTP